VDLIGFEPMTSSMPFKKYQSLTDINTEDKKVSGGRFGTPVDATGGFFTVWTPFGLQKVSTRNGTARVLARGCQPLSSLSAGGDNILFSS
jgi:hypothetical protein